MKLIQSEPDKHKIYDAATSTTGHTVLQNFFKVDGTHSKITIKIILS